MKPIAALGQALLDLLFPRICLGCGVEGTLLCRLCREQLLAAAPSCLVCRRRNFTGILCPLCAERSALRRFLAPFSYRDILVRDLIHAYKYHGVRELAGLFASEIAAFLAFYNIRLPRGTLLVPIPLHRWRERERGFNQARLLAQALGDRLQLTVVSSLRRRRPTEQQIEMDSYEQRRSNVAGSFYLTDPALARKKTIVVVDDVATSGATLSEAARVLRQAGAATVWAIVIAKG